MSIQIVRTIEPEEISSVTLYRNPDTTLPMLRIHLTDHGDFGRHLDVDADNIDDVLKWWRRSP